MIIMEGPKTIFCCSELSWAPEMFSSKFIDTLVARPRKVSSALSSTDTAVSVRPCHRYRVCSIDALVRRASIRKRILRPVSYLRFVMPCHTTCIDSRSLWTGRQFSHRCLVWFLGGLLTRGGRMGRAVPNPMRRAGLLSARISLRISRRRPALTDL